MSTFESNEKLRQGSQDREIIRWLSGFLKEYKLYFVLSLVLMIVTAALEISVPYLTKKAVDSYIYPGWVKIMPEDPSENVYIKRIKESHSGSVIELDNGLLVDLSEIKRSLKTELEKKGIISDTRYLVVDRNSYPENMKENLDNVLNSGKIAFENFGGLFAVSENQLEKLNRDEISTVRYSETKNLKILVLMIFICVLGIFIFTTTFTYLLYYSGHKIMHRIRMNAFSKIIKLPQNFFDKNPVGRLTTRVTNDVNAINDMYTSVMVQFIKDILVVTGIIAIMLTMNVNLTFIIIGLTFFLGIVATLFRMRLKRVFRNIRVTIGKLNAFVQESVRGIMLIKLYGKEQHNLNRFRAINRENLNANMDQLWTYVFFRPFIEYISILGTGLILWYGGVNVIELNLTLGSLIAFLYYVRMVFKPIQELSEKYNIFQSAAAACENLYEIVCEEDEVSGIKKPEFAGCSIEFKNVWFTYNNREWVLKNVSFRIDPGEIVALVGLTGSGKTTVVNLILKFYEASRGEILYNGININEIDNTVLRNSITAVFQDLFLFGKDISEEKINTADVRSEYNMRKDDRREGRMSSGENQIVSLAKAFKKKSPLLIMDEATSHIDAGIEKKIQDKIRENSGDQSKLVIAHRLSNVKEADRIYVIHKGEIVEQGNHDKLLKNRGIYYTLNNFQKEMQRVS